MTKPATLPESVTLPTWTDSAAVTSYLTSLVALVASGLAAVHPGFHVPVVVAQDIPLVGLVVAGGAQALNIWSHRSAQKAAVLVKAAAGIVVHNNVTK